MKIIGLAFLLFVSSQVDAQSYSVIHVIGKIYDSSTQSYLKPGSKLSEAANLKFETATSRAAVLSSKRGRYIIQKTANANSQSDLAYSLASVLSPARGKLSTRAGGINNAMDFKMKFGQYPSAWLMDEYRVSVSSTAYPRDESHFFYVTYQFNGEAINKKLSSEGEDLIFNQTSFFSIDERPINPTQAKELTLNYYDATAEESEEVASLNFSVVSAAELTNLVDGTADLPESEQVEALQDLILSLYGDCSMEEVKAAIASVK